MIGVHIANHRAIMGERRRRTARLARQMSMMERESFIHGTSDPLSMLPYFTEWGGRAWLRLVRLAVTQHIGVDLRGKTVLEIGARSGRMSCLFAMLGARVIGIDKNEEFLENARSEAAKWGVSDRVSFFAAGHVNSFPDESFDVVVTKSVLVVVPELENFLRDISRKLKPGGKIAFVENGRGMWAVRQLRRLRHRRWKGYKAVRFFTAHELQLVQMFFEVVRMKRTVLPPVWLICGSKPGARTPVQPGCRRDSM